MLPLDMSTVTAEGEMSFEEEEAGDPKQ